jgi:hypothetical protein
MVQALIGYSTTIAVANSSGAFVTLAEVTDLTPPGQSVDELDATHMASTDSTRDLTSGLTDPGDMSCELNFIPGGAVETFIFEWGASRQRRAVRITFPNLEALNFNAFVTGFVPANPNDGKLTATLTCKVTGPLGEAAPDGFEFITLGGELLTLGGETLYLEAA